MNVKVGQVWENMDIRSGDEDTLKLRRLLITKVDDEYAYASTDQKPPKKTRIKLDRFKEGPRGFRLAHDVY